MSIKRIGAVVLAAIISAGAFSVPAFAFTGETETVVQDTAAAPSEDFGKDTKETEAQNGSTESTEETESGTIHVRAEDGRLIVSFGDEETEETGQIGVVTTNGSRLNVRFGGGMEYEVLDQLRPGEQVNVVSQEGDWVKIIVPEKTGYVYRDYLRIEDVKQSGGSGLDIPEEYLTMFLQLLGQSSGSSLPLTPEGNLTLVDDVGSPTAAGKQFVTLVTKSGNYFYLIIDRDEKGNENVHFLNQVDEADLFSVMDEDEAAALREQMASEDAASQQEQQPVITPTEPTETEAEPQDQPQSKSRLPYALGLITLIGVCGAGGAFFFLKNKKQQTAAAESPDPDADYREDDDGYDLPEEPEDEDYDESEEE